MSPVAHAARLGLDRGWTSFRTQMVGQDLVTTIVINGALLLVLVLQRNGTVSGTPIPLGLVSLPGVLGMSVGTGGVLGAATMLASNREDGTLLRARTVPHGMVGYLVSAIVHTALSTVAGMLVIILPGLFLIEGLSDAGLLGWATALGVVALGMLATLPWAAVIGSVARSPESSFTLTFLPLGGLVAISGIFYPITALPGWVQGIGQVFPLYWLGLGMRAALLPDTAHTAEIGGSWRAAETVGVLVAWAVVGLLIAPGVLRRMARRESGSTMEARRQRALHRVT